MHNMDLERMEWALREALLPYASSIDPDDFDDIIDFMATECEQSGIKLYILETEASSSSRTLEDLLAHPVTSVLETHLADLINVPEDEVPLVVDEILNAYATGPPTVVEEISRQRGELRTCELCERPTALTEHHLIPRAEHDLFVKRGFFTVEECRTRIAWLCRPCHSAVHRAKTNRELASEFNTVDKLLEVPEVARFAEWNSKRKILRTVAQRRKQR